MTFSSVPKPSKAYYDIEDGDLDWLLNEGPIAYTAVSFMAAYVLMLRGGLRSAVALSCLMTLLAAALRMVPCWMPSHEDPDRTMVFLYVSAFVNAAAAPLTQSAPSLLSQVWFPADQRSLATGKYRIIGMNSKMHLNYQL